MAGDGSIAPGAQRWTPGRAARRAVELLRTEGPKPLLMGVLAETVYRRLVILERDLAVELPAKPPAVPLRYAFLDEAGVEDYERLRPGQGGVARDRLAAGQRCFGTWAGDELVAVRWLATGAPEVEYVGARLPLAPDESYHFDSFTSQAHRRRGFAAASQAEVARVLAGEGFRVTLRAVLPENRAAMQDAARSGFRVVGKIGYVGAGRWRRVFVRRKGSSPADTSP